MGNIGIKSNTHYSIVTVNNWKAYQHTDPEDGQPSGQAMDNQRAGKGQAKDTDKNFENFMKDEKKSTRGGGKYPVDIQGE
ncbi:MAG: hypothetical protein KOO63_10475 [Bacteroidales bacterium]|nr:hypothetical protein [Candidatus Latescibacterota bacterium]